MELNEHTAKLKLKRRVETIYREGKYKKWKLLEITENQKT